MTILLTLLLYIITKAHGFYPPLPAPYYHPPQFNQYPHISQSHDVSVVLKKKIKARINYMC